MKRLALLVFFWASVVSAQTERASKARVSPPSTGISGDALRAAPTPLPFNTPEPLSLPPAAAIPAPPATILTAPISPSPAEEVEARSAPSADAQLSDGAEKFAQASPSERDVGREIFDGKAPSAAAAPFPIAGTVQGDRHLPRATSPPETPKASFPLKQRLGETVEMGGVALVWQMLSGLVFLIAGAHASYPALAGMLWVLGGSVGINYLAQLRSTIVGGWQASHDLRMRHDYSTGQLKDIRGRKYGEDRYDEFAPGRVSERERLVVDGTALLLGLPWIWGAGPKATALYVGSAVLSISLRRLWRLRRPKQK